MWTPWSVYQWIVHRPPAQDSNHKKPSKWFLNALNRGYQGWWVPGVWPSFPSSTNFHKESNSKYFLKGSVGHIGSVATTELCCCGVKAIYKWRGMAVCADKALFTEEGVGSFGPRATVCQHLLCRQPPPDCSLSSSSSPLPSWLQPSL